MSRPGRLALWTRSCFPRVSGDEPPGEAGTVDTLVFSPRERG